MPPTLSDHEAAWDVVHELARTLTGAMDAWHKADETSPTWVALRDAFVAVRMTAEIGEEVCADALAARHLTVAPES